MSHYTIQLIATSPLSHHISNKPPPSSMSHHICNESLCIPFTITSLYWATKFPLLNHITSTDMSATISLMRHYISNMNQHISTMSHCNSNFEHHIYMSRHISSIYNLSHNTVYPTSHLISIEPQHVHWITTHLYWASTALMSPIIFIEPLISLRISSELRYLHYEWPFLQY